MPNLGKLIAAYRHERGMSQTKLANLLGVTKQTISNYERDFRIPDYATLMQISKVLNVPMSYLVNKDGMQPGGDAAAATDPVQPSAPSNVVELAPRKFSHAAMAMASDFDALDDYGRKAVRAVADVELDRLAQEIAQQKAPVVAPVTYIRVKRYDEPAAAGAPVWAESGYTFVQYPENVVPKGTDYAVGLSGHSMEPLYPDGCTVFVRATQTIQQRDVVLAWLEGEGAVCKRAIFNDAGHIIRLESINRNFEDYTLRQLMGMRIMGKVLGYVMG